MSIFTSHRHVISKVIVLALSYHFVVLCLRLFTKFHKIFSGHFKQVLFCFSVANYHTALATFPLAHIFFIMCQASLYAVISLSVRRQKYGYLSSINRDHFFSREIDHSSLFISVSPYFSKLSQSLERDIGMFWRTCAVQMLC